MKILLTGSTGYIGKRLIPMLHNMKHELVCCIRDIKRVPEEFVAVDNITFIEVDFLEKDSLIKIPKDIDVAYYLMHSMSSNSSFEALEQQCAINFKNVVSKSSIKQVVYLSGIVNDESLSKHLSSRKNVENLLKSDNYNLTVFRAGIIVGSGSSSFEIIRDLVEKLPIMITPKWLNTKTQPIAIRDVLSYLTKTIGEKRTYNKSFDIYGPELLTYKKMLLEFAEVRNLKRLIITLPVMTPKLSSYWLYFVTATSYRLACNLVASMKVPIVGKPSEINEVLEIEPISYKEAVAKAFDKIQQNNIVSSWKDAMVSGIADHKIANFIKVPKHGCLKDLRKGDLIDEEKTLNKIWELGGKKGWYYADGLWKIRGILDKVVGGIGLRRGRRDPKHLQAGDALDFWRVLYANKKEKRLLLFAEMKLPGEAWLEFKIVEDKLFQRAVFRPKGLWGRTYWFLVAPFHEIVFKGLMKQLIKVT